MNAQSQSAFYENIVHFHGIYGNAHINEHWLVDAFNCKQF